MCVGWKMVSIFNAAQPPKYALLDLRMPSA
jgi:hypothetical protein